ncbi:hypothetical protein CALCODRAFT_379634 [Calocera cornea HHB12733]|uniref:Uncharacterized protein n=1 Tax=Calocera cornea HHB12733 TaxID=1353952 RepID=A0A165EDW7_9BASI|nr:hypothetical protein CALCODRAFT_379634 [Calocera cornea HHB12733]
MIDFLSSGPGLGSRWVREGRGGEGVWPQGFDGREGRGMMGREGRERGRGRGRGCGRSFSSTTESGCKTGAIIVTTKLDHNNVHSPVSPSLHHAEAIRLRPDRRFPPFNRLLRTRALCTCIGPAQ